MASSLPSSVDLPHILRVKGLAPAIVSRLEEEGFDGLSFLKASPSLLLALKFKGAEIVAIQALQNDDTFKDATVDTGFKATPENATSPVVRRSLRSNSSARNTPSPAHSRHRNSPVGSPNQFGGGRDISSTPTRDPVSLRQRIATNQLAKTVTFAERTSFALKPQQTILPSGKNLFMSNAGGSTSALSKACATEDAPGSSSGASWHQSASPDGESSDDDSHLSTAVSYKQVFGIPVSAQPQKSASQAQASSLGTSQDHGPHDVNPAREAGSSRTSQVHVPCNVNSASKAGSSRTSQVLVPRAVNSMLASIAADTLPQFDIFSILGERLSSKKADREILAKLRNNTLLLPSERKKVIRFLTQYLHEKHVCNPKDVTTEMKEGLAKSFVTAVPVYQQQDFLDENSQPWHHVYHPRSSGWIANASRPFQRKNRKRKTKGNDDSFEEAQLMGKDAIQSMAELMPGRHERAQILDGMAASFNNRQKLRLEGIPIRAMLEKYPHLKNYDGEVMKEEFQRLYPKAEDMCRPFSKMLPKMLLLPERRELALAYNDDVVKALMLLSQHLPHDIPQSGEKDVSHTWALEQDLVLVVQPNENIDELISSKRQQAAGSVQPYLVLVRNPVTENILRTFLILDDFAVQLSTNSFLKGIDWLFKSFFVFGLRYPYGWRNTFHFLQICFYKIRENCGKKDMMNSSEFELWKSLSQP